ncbi:lactate 2-monooxygenase [Renibacterium salmoninarum ATCC 33209]|uniref:Lactate 2-monooxygenase n=1 Tax=Renibacterium salmoninarum (strain ATCC 33209 / DSM 20767 / JCM 11484 / NBRC 15589 / NCIMB 2235) TaxID=288705 RepID=A9WTN7_RENSM|nr:lactate 2-monooxygenase [Renibacterium salmoninarum ATCC 33209]
MANFADYQLGIYLAGTQGRKPALPISSVELEAAAHSELGAEILGYVAGGAGDEQTQRANTEAFANWGLMPRMLRGAEKRDLSIELFGHRYPSPNFPLPSWRTRRLPCRRRSRDREGSGNHQGADVCLDSFSCTAGTGAASSRRHPLLFPAVPAERS